ncbi:hypothetical protein ABPG75_012906 [Micractinium tetrahymenae]
MQGSGGRVLDLYSAPEHPCSVLKHRKGRKNSGEAGLRRAGGLQGMEHKQCIPWIEDVFGDCVDSTRDLVGFSAGLLSISCWLVAQMPQLYRNYKTQSAEALSAWFLSSWLLGDTFNLVGALLKGDQPPTVVLTAQYFICVDAVMMIQYIYYQSLQRRRERMLAARRQRHPHHHRRHSHHRRSSRDGSSGQRHQQHEAHSGSEGGSGPAAILVAPQHEHADGDAEIVSSGGGGGGSGRVPAAGAAAGRDVSFRPQRVLACLGALLLVAHLQPGQQQQQQQQPGQQLGQQQVQLAAAAGGSGMPLLSSRRLLQAAGAALGAGSTGGMGVKLPAWSYTAGTALGYASSLLYLLSRVSQLWKNHSRRSAEGLAISMFLCAIAANSLYGASILIRSYTWPELRSSLPWLVGSLGTVALDLAIFAQARALGSGPKHHPSDEDEPLLQP